MSSKKVSNSPSLKSTPAVEFDGNKNQRTLISPSSIIKMGAESRDSADAGSVNSSDVAALAGTAATVAEISAEIVSMMSPKNTNTKEQKASALRHFALKLCTIGSMEACECFLKVITAKGVLTGSIARYGLTTIANCTTTDENRNKLLAMGAGEFICYMLEVFGEEHASVGQYGIIAVTNLTSSATIRSKLGSLGICKTIIRMLELHGSNDDPSVAIYGLYAVGKLSLNHDVNRRRFGMAGACQEIINTLKKHGESNHQVADNGMYALAHLAYYNVENKLKLSHVDTYKVIIQLVKKHGCDHISVASFGLTAVSNLIHTEESKNRFGSLGMCELVLQLGQHHNMQPEALANNVVFTIGKLAHNHDQNSDVLAKHGGVALVLKALQSYGVQRMALAGNGLYALGALSQSNKSVREKLSEPEVCELLTALLLTHAVEDLSVAMYGLHLVEVVVSTSNKALQFLVKTNLAVLTVHVLRCYVFNMINCNADIAARAVAVLANLVNAGPKALHKELTDIQVVTTLQKLVLNNVAIMDPHTNQLATDIIAKCSKS